MNQTTEPIKIEQEGNILVFSPQGDLGSLSWTTDQQVLHQLLERIEGQHSPRVVIDMEDLTFADSALLAVLVSLWKHVTGSGGKMVLSAVPFEIAEVLRYTKLDTIWQRYPRRHEAISAVKA